MAEEETKQESTETPSSDSQKPSETFTTLLESIKDGERQKYGTVEDALKSIPSAQDHIKSLEEKNQELEKKLQEASSIDALMTKLEEKATSQEHQPQSEQVFDESKLESVLETKLTQLEQKKAAERNVSKVIETMTEKFGEKAEAVYEQLAADSGVGMDFLNTLAAKSPTAVLKLAGITEKATPKQPGAIDTSIRSEGIGNNQDKPSARVKMVGASSDELVNAWKNTAPTT